MEIQQKANSLALLALQQLPHNPSVALKITQEAYKTYAHPLIHKQLMDIKSRYRFYDKTFIGSLAKLSPKGLFTDDLNNNLCLYSLEGKRQATFTCKKSILSFVEHEENVYGVDEEQVYAWDMNGELKNVFPHTLRDPLLHKKCDGELLLSCYQIIDEVTYYHIWNLYQEKVITLPSTDAMFFNRPLCIVFAEKHALILTSEGISGDLLMGVPHNYAHIWSYDGELLFSLTGHNCGICCASFSPTQELIVTGSYDSQVILWNFKGQILQKFHSHTHRITSVNFSHDGQKIISTSVDGTAVIQNLKGKELHTLHSGQMPLKTAMFGDNDTVVVSVDTANNVRLWDVSEAKTTVFSRTSDEGFVAVSHSGRYLLVQNDFGDEDSLDLYDKFSFCDRLTTNEAFGDISPDEQYIVTQGNGDYYSGDWFSYQGVGLWSINGELLRSFPLHDVVQLRFSPVDETILVRQCDCLQLLDYQGKTRTRFSIPSPIVYCDFSRCGQKIYIAEQQAIKVYNIDGEITENIALQHAICCCVISNEYIVAGNKEGSILLWERSGKFVRKFRAHDAQITCIQIYNDYILSGAKDRIAKLWNTAGEQLQTFTGHKSPIKTVAFVGEKNKILTACASYGYLWNNFTHTDIDSPHLVDLHRAGYTISDEQFLSETDKVRRWHYAHYVSTSTAKKLLEPDLYTSTKVNLLYMEICENDCDIDKILRSDLQNLSAYLHHNDILDYKVYSEMIKQQPHFAKEIKTVHLGVKQHMQQYSFGKLQQAEDPQKLIAYAYYFATLDNQHSSYSRGKNERNFLLESPQLNVYLEFTEKACTDNLSKAKQLLQKALLQQKNSFAVVTLFNICETLGENCWDKIFDYDDFATLNLFVEVLYRKCCKDHPEKQSFVALLKKLRDKMPNDKITPAMVSVYFYLNTIEPCESTHTMQEYVSTLTDVEDLMMVYAMKPPQPLQQIIISKIQQCLPQQYVRPSVIREIIYNNMEINLEKNAHCISTYQLLCWLLNRSTTNDEELLYSISKKLLQRGYRSNKVCEVYCSTAHFWETKARQDPQNKSLYLQRAQKIHNINIYIHSTQKIAIQKQVQHELYTAWNQLLQGKFCAAEDSLTLVMIFSNTSWPIPYYAHWLLLTDQWQLAKQVYEEYCEKPYPEDNVLFPKKDYPQNFRQAFLRSLIAIQEYGIRHPQINTVQQMLKGPYEKAQEMIAQQNYQQAQELLQSYLRENNNLKAVIMLGEVREKLNGKFDLDVFSTINDVDDIHKLCELLEEKREPRYITPLIFLYEKLYELPDLEKYPKANAAIHLNCLYSVSNKMHKVEAFCKLLSKEQAVFYTEEIFLELSFAQKKEGITSILPVFCKQALQFLSEEEAYSALGNLYIQITERMRNWENFVGNNIYLHNAPQIEPLVESVLQQVNSRYYFEWTFNINKLAIILYRYVHKNNTSLESKLAEVYQEIVCACIENGELAKAKLLVTECKDIQSCVWLGNLVRIYTEEYDVVVREWDATVDKDKLKHTLQMLIKKGVENSNVTQILNRR